MNYSSYLFAPWLFVFLGYVSCFPQDTIRKDLKTLMEYFNESTTSEISNDGTLFLSMMDRWKEDSDKKILMSQILTVYFKIFEIFKNNTTIQKSLDSIKENMIRTFFSNTTASKLNDFEAIINIQVNDLRVQKKAMFELAQVMNNLSSKPLQRKRKRRQNRSQGAFKQ